MSADKGKIQELRVPNALGIRFIDTETGRPLPVPERMTNQFFFPPQQDDFGNDTAEGYHGVQPGYYTLNEVVQLLRDNKGNADAVQYIADMLEE